MSLSQLEFLRQKLLPTFEDALNFAAAQTRRIIDIYPGYNPMYTVGGRWNREGERWTNWCEGFFPGILWLLYEWSGDPDWRRYAEEYSRPLEPRKFDRDVHDLGFIFGSTYLRWYRAVKEPALWEVAVQAGRTLALRRQKGGYLASFIGPESLFIDIMMNVPLILWVALETNDDRLRNIALDHCRVTKECLVREDGSTAHEGLFNIATGEFERQSTHQGWKADSAWARGQAWALYGFTMIARLLGTQKPTHGGAWVLETARKCADFWLSHVPEGAVPLWDLDVPNDGNQPLDSSAAAIAASGLWDLSEIVKKEIDKERYALAALKTMETLCSVDFLPKNHPEWEGVLMHGVYHKHKGLGVDESVAWGEYFFVEAIVKAVLGKSVTPY